LILIAKALAQKNDGQKTESIATLSEAEDWVLKNPEEGYSVYDSIGRLFLDLEKPAEALAMLKKAAELTKDENAVLRLKYLAAQCYEAMNQKNEYTSLYNQIAEVNDPLWSQIAQERIDTLQFEDMVKTVRSNSH
jgi:tetratricopeptide (TPR) repeat protein